jgi:hypothetical protein
LDEGVGGGSDEWMAAGGGCEVEWTASGGVARGNWAECGCEPVCKRGGAGSCAHEWVENVLVRESLLNWMPIIGGSLVAILWRLKILPALT